MSSHQHEAHAPPPEHHSNVRHIPIFVEGRDEPVINRGAEHGAHFAETKSPRQSPPAPAPHIDRDAYFADDGPVGFHHPPNFTRAFGTPFNKGFRQGPQPFVQQKAYPQNAFARGASPQRAQSPLRDEHYVKVPVQHEPAPARPSPARTQPEPARAQHKQAPAPARQPSPTRQQPSAAREPTPPPRQAAPSDPITQILSIQTDVLNLMTEVENFAGTKKDKRYLFLDEMLTRNLIKLDNIETEGKENIRQARKEAIKCIQKCIAVLEAKASNASNAAQPQPQPHAQDVEMKENTQPAPDTNGEVDMMEPPKTDEKVDSQTERIDEQPSKEHVEAKREPTPKSEEQTQAPTKPEEQTQAPAKSEEQTQAPPAKPDDTQQAAADTRPEQAAPAAAVDEQKTEVDNKPSPKKKVVKKRDKSKEAAKESSISEAPKDSSAEEASKDSNKTEVAQDKVEVMQVDDKGEKPMEVDGAASQ